jgi:hypothetical protein
MYFGKNQCILCIKSEIVSPLSIFFSNSSSSKDVGLQKFVLLPLSGGT